MGTSLKYEKILDALDELLKKNDISSISVSEIAAAAGIGKGSIYYYFSSKEAIWDALIQRTYQKPLETAKHLAEQTTVPIFTRMAMMFQACRNSSTELMSRYSASMANSSNQAELALLQQKYLNYLIKELKPELTSIIRQGIDAGEIDFNHPEALSEIVLIVLGVKISNTMIPTSPEETAETLHGLVALLEKITPGTEGSLNFLSL